MKMIRKFISFAAMAALVLSAGSCQKEITAGIDDGGAKVNFTLLTSDQTKAIADASNIDILHWEIYPEDVENATKPLAKGTEKDTDGDGAFTLELSLILDQTYNFIFWAQVDREEGKEHYDVSDLRRVGIKTYDDELANDESRAAFFAHETIHVSGSIEETITLYRPFSQLNLGTETYDVSSLNLTDPLKVNHSEVTVYGIADTFNTISGEGEGSQDVHFQKNITPNGDEDAVKKILEVNDNEYYWLGMNYLIVNGNSDNVKVDMLFHTTHGNVDLSIDNVPVKENYRTNIIGDLLTSEAIFEIVIDEKFQTPDIIVGDEGGSDDGGGNGQDPDDPNNPGGNTPGEDNEDEPKEGYERVVVGDEATYTVYNADGLEVWRKEAHEGTFAGSDNTVEVINLVLAADIELPLPEEGQSNWIPVGSASNPYDGYINGNGHTISNLTIVSNSSSSSAHIGFISNANNHPNDEVIVENIKFDNVNISTKGGCTGAVLGFVASKGGVIKNVHILGGTVRSTSRWTGGIAGDTSEGNAIIDNCSNAAEVIGGMSVGGIVGDGYVINSTNTGDVTGTSDWVGGITGGCIYKQTENCSNTGNISGANYVAGIAGDGGATDCVNRGKVTGVNYVGGIVGDCFNNYSLYKCSNYGKITGQSYTGGIVGQETKRGTYVSLCYNYANVSGTKYVGGIAGNSINLSASENSGDVSGNDIVGGIVGEFRSGTLSANTNKGTIKSKGNKVGLIFGNHYSGTVANDNVAGGKIE